MELNEAEWMELASLLLDEGEWGAAREWLLEAAPLLRAQGEREHEARCDRLLAQIASLHGQPADALKTALDALSLCPLELPEWCEAVGCLATYRAAVDEQAAIATLNAAVSLAAQLAAEHPSAASDARLAIAALQTRHRRRARPPRTCGLRRRRSARDGGPRGGDADVRRARRAALGGAGPGTRTVPRPPGPSTIARQA